jgi:hypothetical protein
MFLSEKDFLGFLKAARIGPHGHARRRVGDPHLLTGVAGH